ncbi:DUF6056 family protein [Enterococcus malodoratus]|uniref:DUF6056 family protein n=1 Tax=Enterococcus malodoratus TaxID=71451 RepID=UPI0021655E05|nr:DUF6056 family protein [Enterococcus malodoratus]
MNFNQSKNRRGILMVVGLVFLVCLIFNLNIHLTGFKDDGALFLNPLKNKFDGNFLSFLMYRYNTWSSRIVIEIFTLIGVTVPIVWKLLNAVMMLIAAILPAFLIKRYKDIRWTDLVLSASLFFTFPISFFSETGWVATSTNYLWVYSLGLVSIYPIVQYIRKEHVPQWLYILSAFTTFYASNQEQMALLILGFLLIFGGYLFTQKRSFKPLLPTLGINIFSLIFVFTAKGNDIRYEHELKNWFPDFEQLSYFKRIELGYSSTLRHLFFDNQITILLFTLLLFVFTITRFIYRKKFSLIGVVGLFPFIISLYFSLNSFINNGRVVQILNMFNQYGTTFSIYDPKTWIPDIILSIILFTILLSIIYLLDYQVAAYLPILFICAAIASRLIMGFSPTIWASATRTYLFTYGLFMIAFLYIYTHSKVFNVSKLGMVLVTTVLALYSLFTAFGTL